MIADFVNEDLGTTAYTNVVSSDGYEVTNLLCKQPKRNDPTPAMEMSFALGTEHDLIKRACNGFMADYFVKPPVDVVIQFPCLVDIHRIVVNRKSGAKNIAEFIVSCANARPDNSISRPTEKRDKEPSSDNVRLIPAKKSTENPINQNLSSSSKTNDFLCDDFRPFPCRYEPDFSSTEVRKLNLHALHIVGRFNSKTTSANIIIFNNARTRLGRSSFESMDDSTHRLPMFSLQYLFGVSHLIVRILRTEGSTVAAVKRLEVWSTPSHRNGTTLNQKAQSLLRQYKDKCFAETLHRRSNGDSATKKSLINAKNEKQPEECNTNSQEMNHSHDANLFKIPEDFIDPITYDMMILPVLLPSGHTVDATTLEKCIKQDERNGRMPLDPFTGIPLKDESKAIPNTALKLRLDNFLLQNKTCVKQNDTMKKTIGVKSLNVNLIEQVIKKNNKRRIEVGSDKVYKQAKNPYHVGKQHSIAGINTTLRGDDKIETAKDSNKSISQQVVRTNSREALHKSSAELPDFPNKMAEQGISHCSTIKSHEENLKDCLEAALKHATKYVWKPRREKSVFTESNCSSCKAHWQEINLYQLPCNHAVCRKCMHDDAGARKCKVCSRYFSSGEVTRLHFSKYFGP